MDLSQFSELIYAASAVTDGNLSFTFGEKNEVLKRRERFLSRLDIKPKQCIGIKLCHSDKVEIVSKNQTGACILSPENCSTVDAMITNERGLFLFLLTADCLPIAYYDPQRRIVALAHLSWMNTDKNLAGKVIETMKSHFGTDSTDILVSVGPYIHKDSYKHNRIKQKESPSWQPFLEQLPDGQFLIDMLAYNKQNMLRAGILAENIKASEIDTYVSLDYFSHYRSKQTGEPEGRFATVIGMRG